EGRLPGFPVLARGTRSLEREVDAGVDARAGDAARRERRVERAALDERFERRLVHASRVDAAREVEKIVERPTLGARFEDRLERRVADSANGAEPEPDLRLVRVAH